MSVTLGPTLLMVGGLNSIVLWKELDALGVHELKPLAALPTLGALALWYHGANKTGRPALTFGWGVDHTGAPRNTWKAIVDALRGDDEDDVDERGHSTPIPIFVMAVVVLTATVFGKFPGVTGPAPCERIATLTCRSSQSLLPLAVGISSLLVATVGGLVARRLREE